MKDWNYQRSWARLDGLYVVRTSDREGDRTEKVVTFIIFVVMGGMLALAWFFPF